MRSIVIGMSSRFEIARDIAALLTERKKTVAVAESCTGGMLGGAITSVSGSSVFFLGGIIAYADAVKMRELEINSSALQQHGAVSEEVVSYMASNVKERFGSDFGIAITGIAGPEGGMEGKPVGLVFIGVAGAEDCVVKEFHFEGDRESVRESSCAEALHLLKRLIVSSVAPAQGAQ